MNIVENVRNKIVDIILYSDVERNNNNNTLIYKVIDTLYNRIIKTIRSSVLGGILMNIVSLNRKLKRESNASYN